VRGIGSLGFVSSATAGASLLAGCVAFLCWGRAALAPDRLLGAGLVVTAVASSAVMRGHHGGFANVHLPMFWFVALAAAFAMARLRTSFGPVGVVVGALALSVQLGVQVRASNLDRLVPTARDREVGDAVVAVLRAERGPMLSPYAAWLPVLAGHEPSWHLIALWDVAQHDRTPFPEAGPRLREAFADHHWAVVVDGDRTVGYGMPEHYVRKQRLPGSGREFAGKTGWPQRPRYVMVPRLPSD
jgi:hypothetical protein